MGHPSQRTSCCPHTAADGWVGCRVAIMRQPIRRPLPLLLLWFQLQEASQVRHPLVIDHVLGDCRLPFSR